MPGTKEIRMKIRSVQNTRKITKAMEMVAASKMRKAQERMRQSRPYGEKIRNVAAHISHANPEYRHPFLVERDTVKGIGVIVVTTDKGLCVMQRLGANVASHVVQLGDRPQMDRLIGAVKVMLDGYTQDRFDRLMLFYTRYIEAIIFQAVAENMSSEQSARMVAMKSASDNAETLIDELTLVYNKNRQAGITKEISEIVGGAAAV